MTVDKLQKAYLDGNSRANVIVRTVDLDESPVEAMVKLWQAQSGSELPWMVVRYPRFSRVTEDAWAGRFTADAVDVLLNSPIRQEIARRIISGEAAVWVLLESGVQQQDEAAANLLETQLKKMSENLKILMPEGDVFGDNVKTPATEDLSVTFSMIRLSRSDSRERMFVHFGR